MSKYKRQIDIINEEELNFPIHIIGAGGIGSWTALLLAKMGCPNISIYDDDIVEEHNIVSQFFSPIQLGMLKVKALQNNIEQQTGKKILIFKQEEELNINEGLIIIAVDSMKERYNLNELFKDKNCYIIDGRMGGLQLEIDSRPANEYESTLVTIQDIEPEPCTARSICFNCAVIGGLITNLVRLFARGKIKNTSFTYLFDTNQIFYK